MPQPSEPARNLTEAVEWLKDEAQRIIRASMRTMADGTHAFPPQVGIGYEAFWLRDYEYTLEGAVGVYTDDELKASCRLFLRHVRDDGAGLDCVKFDDSPIYKPGYGNMGREPVTDGPAFTVGVAWHTWQHTGDEALRQEAIEPLTRTLNYVPRNPDNGLVHIAQPGDRCPYGFTDTVPKSGDQLFDSLLFIQACRQMADLSGESRWRKEAERVAASVRTILWDGEAGLFRAATGNCNVPDIWGSAFAVFLKVATPEQSRRVASYFRDHYGELVQHGQVRHLPGFLNWKGEKTPVNGGDYQHGAFWATPVGWFVYTLDLVDPALADRTVMDMVNHFKQHGACEWINSEKRALPGYLASAALPLDGIRAMRARRSHD